MNAEFDLITSSSILKGRTKTSVIGQFYAEKEYLSLVAAVIELCATEGWCLNFYLSFSFLDSSVHISLTRRVFGTWNLGCILRCIVFLCLPQNCA